MKLSLDKCIFECYRIKGQAHCCLLLEAGQIGSVYCSSVQYLIAAETYFRGFSAYP